MPAFKDEDVLPQIDSEKQHATNQTLETEKQTPTATTSISPDASESEASFLVAFSEPTDPLNPKDWPLRKKFAVTFVLSTTGFTRIMVSTIIAPALSTIATELDMNDVESLMSLSGYLLATAFGPLIIGPLTEIYGRQPVLHVSNVWFLMWNIVCGFANTKGLLIASRLLAGFGASAIYSLAGGVLGDMWRPEQRGRAVAVYQLIPLLGSAVGPIVGGIVTQYSTWRWCFWGTSIAQGIMFIYSFLIYYESYAPTILTQKAKHLRKTTGDPRYHTASMKLEEGKFVRSVLGRNLSRPLRMLLFHPIIQVMASLSAFSYGILYLVLSTFADMWDRRYHESIAVSGLHYIACALGEIAGAQIGGPIMDHIYKRLKSRARGDARPEFHLPTALSGWAIITPIGLLLYGWAAQYIVHWIVVDIGVFLFSFGLQVGGGPLYAYVITSYPDHASSATAASQFLRSLTAFSFPLFAPKMYSALGYGWGNTMLAFITIAIGIPAPLLVYRYGPWLRAKAASRH